MVILQLLMTQSRSANTDCCFISNINIVIMTALTIVLALMTNFSLLVPFLMKLDRWILA
uniref:Uncharacterized protein n=1 Tax=Candidatus Kentrum sp. FW TaxID=2126338 RepID=A0A450SD30_9GAMM|nr:MAG: hypothetical protein BECKFW1821A_GA0114235_102716 [Candidatus Kentron sp. FW]VFJ55112.1 MAG: hypothetical protein BECKFW1821B_GA0114236_102119 [Candidatus Kentron sp. FW]